MIVNSEGARPSASKVEAIAQILHPTSVEELYTFLKVIGYLRRRVEKGQHFRYFTTKSFSQGGVRI